MKILKIILIIFFIVVFLFLIASVVASNVLINYAIARVGDGGERTVTNEVVTAEAVPVDDVKETIKKNQEAIHQASKEYVLSAQNYTVDITAVDGTNLKGWVYEVPEKSEKWVIAIHGYRADHKMMNSAVQGFGTRGMNVIVPDLRACGESGGNYVGMGWTDKDDILCWIHWIIQKNPHSQIVIFGVSMGGATTLMLSGCQTPDNVKCFIEDCGYTSVWDIFEAELNLRFHLPSFPLMNIANLMCKLKAGYSFKEASSLNQVRKCEKPMLFIHGTADDFVPYKMEKILFEAKPGTNKEEYIGEGAGHGESIYISEEKYWDSIFSFLNKYL